MTTYEMITALVATRKFTLPPHFAESYDEDGKPAALGFLMHDKVAKQTEIMQLDDATAFDLCAMHFAREMDDIDEDCDGIDTPEFCTEWDACMGRGAAADAIAALYEAAKEAP